MKVRSQLRITVREPYLEYPSDHIVPDFAGMIDSVHDSLAESLLTARCKFCRMQ